MSAIIVVASIGISGLIFLIIAFIIRGVSGTHLENEAPTYGLLVGFKHMVYDPGVDAAPYDSPEYEEIDENIPTSYPILQFDDNGKVVVTAAEYANNRLTKQDIGKQLKIRYSKTGRVGKEVYRVYLDDTASQKERLNIQSRLFWIFTIIAIVLIVLAMIAYAVFFKKIK